MATEDKPELTEALAWYRTHVDQVSKHRGQWVAIGPEGVVSHDKEIKTVVTESKKKGCGEPLLFKVPPVGVLALWRV